MNCSPSLQGLAAAVVCALLTAPALLADPPNASAATASGEDTPLKFDAPTAAEPAAGGGGGIVRTIVGLAVVIGVIFGIHWLLKQVKSSRENRSTGGGLEPISTLQLGPGRSLHLIRAGHEIILVGSAEHGVTPIRVYREDEAQALGLLDGEAATQRDGRRRAIDRAPDPMNASPGHPPKARDLVRTVQSWTVRR